VPDPPLASGHFTFILGRELYSLFKILLQLWNVGQQ
jgi:hypothetical protein